MKYRVVAIAVAGFSIAAGIWACGGEEFPLPLGSPDAAPPGDATVADGSNVDGGSTSEAGPADAAPSLDASFDAWTPPHYDCPSLDSIDGGVADAFAPSNFDPTLIDTSAVSDIDVTDVGGGCLFDTDALTFTCAHQSFVYTATSVAQTGAPALAVFATGAFTIEPGVVIDAFGTRALVIYAQGAVDIEGELRSSFGINEFVDAGPRSTMPSGTGPGFGGAYCGAAGGRAPDVDSSAAIYGTAPLIPLQGGSRQASGMSDPGPIAYGGGAIQLTSITTITIGASGLVDVNGSGGTYGGGLDGFGTGGASGGAILLEAPILTVAGGLAANGGGGDYVLTMGFNTGNASPGVAQAPSCAAAIDGGGAGSYGDDPNGGQLGTQCVGGGGAGRIALKTRACAITGILSPSSKSGCANAFPLAP